MFLGILVGIVAALPTEKSITDEAAEKEIKGKVFKRPIEIYIHETSGGYGGNTGGSYPYYPVPPPYPYPYPQNNNLSNNGGSPITVTQNQTVTQTNIQNVTPTAMG